MIKIDWGKIQFLSNARWRATYLLHQAGTSWLIGACVCHQKGADFYCWFNSISHTPNFVQKHSILSSKGSWQRFWQSVFFFYILFLFLTEPLFFALPNKIPPLLLFHNSAQFRTISQPNSFLNSKFCNGKNIFKYLPHLELVYLSLSLWPELFPTNSISSQFMALVVRMLVQSNSNPIWHSSILTSNFT